jgi:uncharacterized protein DUF1573
MSNDFGTVSVRRDRGREIDLLRQHYNRHRETLAALANDAPSEHLAAEYQRLIREIDHALGKLGELEGKVPADTNPAMRPDTGAGTTPTPPPPLPRTEPGSRQLRTPPSVTVNDAEAPAPNAIPRIAAIIIAGVVVLALIGWLMWRASGERPMTSVHPTETQTPSTAPAPGPVTPAPKPVPVAALGVDPPAQDYGTIRKGTRAVRQFQVTNNGDQPITLEVARSACKCLYYDYAPSVAPRGKETITVTVDGAKARSGALHETVSVSTKKDPSITGNFEVSAVIR